MDYRYENLGDERFQELCTVLISTEFPNIQALPVGQPDGGRDTIAYNLTNTKKEFLVFQVKFVRNGDQEKNVLTWLEKIIDKESSKVNTLREQGARGYYILTNLKGTAHLKTGSKDKLNRKLEDDIIIPTICWWRDDISRLLEKSPMVKWSFPEILNGQDILNSIIFKNLAENEQRRESVMKSYLADQFEIDNEVKFKQIDLRNKLLDLYVDVPIRIGKFDERNRSLQLLFHALESERHWLHSVDRHSTGRILMGAAQFILHPLVNRQIERVLLEGGPGQGKSTISQYVCQVHRSRILDKTFDINLLPNDIRNSLIRLPIKIDLRDVAFWVERKNPYPSILSQSYFEANWSNSLQSFITAHIYHHSQIDGFDSYDFISVCKTVPILLVFDGFDEIADISVRKDVIEFINKGITRILANCLSLQVLITSRPAVFSESLGFSVEHYPHMELADITTPVINEYVEKWIMSSQIQLRDATELRLLIQDKLELPHLKDLSRSPMQLAILLSLLRTKGQSLPNKRTELYDSYINLFFDRESEKNLIIRDNRYLIIEIHQYLAWVLHSEAELYKNNGSIGVVELNTRLKKYLESEGQDSSITDQLFNAMYERVCALTSRVQGTFEFEVQPLREYFCAKYLYESAPHSSVGNPQTGSKPDRLYVILRNIYWQNVVRFFIGCADAGELDMIIQELSDLSLDHSFKNTGYPELLISQILSDYSFNHKPKKQNQLVKILSDRIDSGRFVYQARTLAGGVKIPKDCGRLQVVQACFRQLLRFPISDYSLELFDILNINPLDCFEIWSEQLSKFRNEELTTWMFYGQKIDVVNNLDSETLKEIIKEGDGSELEKRLNIIIFGNIIHKIEDDAQLKHVTFELLLRGERPYLYGNEPLTATECFVHIISPSIFISLLKNQDRSTLDKAINNRHFLAEEGFHINGVRFDINDSIDEKIYSFIELTKELRASSGENFKVNLDPWDQFIEYGRSIFGEKWTFCITATISAGIRGESIDILDHYNLFDRSKSLCKRVKYARTKSGSIKYWNEMFNYKNVDFNLYLLVIITWGTPRLLISVITEIDTAVRTLSCNELRILENSLVLTTRDRKFAKSEQNESMSDWQKFEISDECKLLLSIRLRGVREKYIYESINSSGKINNLVKISRYRYLLSRFTKRPFDEVLLEKLSIAYMELGFHEESLLNRRYVENLIDIPLATAEIIMKDTLCYPRLLVASAEWTFRNILSKNLDPIGTVAEKNKWFVYNS